MLVAILKKLHKGYGGYKLVISTERRICMPIMYLIDRNTLNKLLKLLKELKDQNNYKKLMQHDSFKREGRRLRQVNWG